MKAVVVASGKGGTGKTTLTAVLAHLAASRFGVVLADTDVEASNLPLALSVSDASCETFSGGAKARIDAGACTACGLCADVCRFDAVREGSSAYAIDPLSCEGCGRCATVCPSGAIAMVPSEVGTACTGLTPLGPIAFGQLGPGEDLSGRLVTEVRGRADAAAGQHAADLLLIDGPPGVGCPLIAAVASTDLLLAVAEPTISGAHDLGRLADLAKRLDVPVRVVLNKADLSANGAARVRELCETRGIPVVAEVPFDPRIASLLEASAADGGRIVPDAASALGPLALAWENMLDELMTDPR
jgi:MinD superfamily P-loop ATPase